MHFDRAIISVTRAKSLGSGAAANRFQMAGIVYELSAAVTGVVRFLFSKRNAFLPTGTRVVFQLEQKLRLVPATDAPVRVLTVSDNARE